MNQLSLGRFTYFVYLLLWLSLLTSPVRAQQLENPNTDADENESTYFINMKLKYMDNERTTEESNYADVYQRKLQNDAKANLVFHDLHLDANYKRYNSQVRVDKDESRIFDQRDNISIWVPFLNVFYIYAQNKGTRSEFNFLDESVLTFLEFESAVTNAQGLGCTLGNIRLGYAFNASFKWAYKVDMLGSLLIDEEIKFDVESYELIKRTTDKEGIYFEFGFKVWKSKESPANRTGFLDKHEGYLLLGYGVSDSSSIYYGEKLSEGKIKTQLPSNNSDVTRDLSYKNSILGFEIGVADDKQIYIERQMILRGIDFSNINYTSDYSHLEDEITVGLRLNDRFSIEFKMGNTTIAKKYAETVVNNQSYYYKQKDNLIGISLNLQFSD